MKDNKNKIENNKQKNNNLPLELDDNSLDTVSGGNLGEQNNLENDTIKDETMLIIPIV